MDFLKGTIAQINERTFTHEGNRYQSYGIKLEDVENNGVNLQNNSWNTDEWVNIADWDHIYDDKNLSVGDEVKITEPKENSYQKDDGTTGISYKAKFVDPNMNDNGTRGFSDKEQILKNQQRIIDGLTQIYNLLNDEPQSQAMKAEKEYKEEHDVDSVDVENIDF